MGVDYMTRWAEATTSVRITAKEVAKFVYESICCKFGVPLEILFDKGPGFRGDSVGELMKKLGIERRHSTSYYSQCNGLEEKMNGMICKIIIKQVVSKPKDWDKHLSVALWGYRTSFRTSLSYTAYHLVFCKEAILPIEVHLARLKILAIKNEGTPDDRLKQRILDLERLELDREMANEHYATQAERRRQKFNEGLKDKELKRGMLVLHYDNRFDTRKDKKLMSRWEGPYVVRKKFINGSYRLQDISGKLHKTSVNGWRLKPYFQRFDAEIIVDLPPESNEEEKEGMKALCYDYSQSSTKLGLPVFIVIFGIASTILSQTPTFHSLRHLNLVSFASSITYAVIVVSGSLIAYHSKDKPLADYKVIGDSKVKVMNAFNALSVLSTMFGNALVVETQVIYSGNIDFMFQASISKPIKDNMVKGLHLCYVATIATFFSVAITGYWAFGNASNSNIFLSMVSTDGTTYIPSWIFVLGNLCMIIQLIAGSVLYSQPTFEIIERGINRKSCDDRSIFFNAILRLILRTCFMMLATLLAAMLPFFGDFNAIVGALGYMPLVFIYPICFYLKLFEVPPLSVNFSIHSSLLFVFVSATIIGVFASVRQFIIDEKTFKIFADL
ncbi:hypothetical protein L7F22_054057 [Adiantum nelumboides]|nr:hypothetical protein [Adiantum nelumboides]